MPDRWRAPRVDAVVVTCEHGGRNVPVRYKRVFAPHRALLESHRGWDPGALELARRFARDVDAPLFYSTTTRLLVELNRSIGHPSLFSIATKPLSRDARRAILDAYYHPYRDAVESAIAECVRARRTVFHLSVHTFTPVLGDEVRNADVGLLYDPKRARERAFAAAWRDAILRHTASDTSRDVPGFTSPSIAPPPLPRGDEGGSRGSGLRKSRRAVERPRDPESGKHSGGMRVRLNYPYRGAADGFTTHLRRRFPGTRYMGVELEVNQRFVLGERARWLRVQRLLADSLMVTLARAAR